MFACVVLPDKDLTYVPITKNASSSILAALWAAGADPQQGKSVAEISTSKAVTLLRHPTKRAWSAYNYLKLRRPPTWLSDLENEPWYPPLNTSWAEFLAALAQERDRLDMSGALVSQVEHLCSSVEYIYVPWDFVQLEAILGCALGHRNASSELGPMPDVTPEMQQHLNLIYGEDYQLWEANA